MTYSNASPQARAYKLFVPSLAHVQVDHWIRQTKGLNNVDEFSKPSTWRLLETTEIAS